MPSVQTRILLAVTLFLSLLAIATERLTVELARNSDLTFYGALFGNLIGMFGLLTSASFAFDLQARHSKLSDERDRARALEVAFAVASDRVQKAELFGQRFIQWSHDIGTDEDSQFAAGRDATVMQIELRRSDLVDARIDLLPTNIVSGYLAATEQGHLMCELLKQMYGSHANGQSRPQRRAITDAVVFLVSSQRLFFNQLATELGIAKLDASDAGVLKEMTNRSLTSAVSAR